ncbi:solute carrier organic anion transporter family member 74D-like isoform X2 [Penaeus monodon]|nr:solute carrier organic anion transporter family member 74D-like isoform X2 [Penaeus monodon]
MSKRLRMRFRRRDREGYEASTIFTSAVRSLFLPLLDTSGESDKAEPKKKGSGQKSGGKQPPQVSEPEEKPLVNDAEECGDAESPCRPSAVNIPRIDVPQESDEVVPVQLVLPSDDQPGSGLQPISTEFRQVSPTFRRGRFSITELEVVNIDTEKLRKIRAESDGQERSPSPSAKEDSKDDTIDDDRLDQSSADAKSARDKNDSGVSSSSGCDKTDSQDQTSNADLQQSHQERPATPQPDTREREARKSPSLTPVDKDGRNGFFVPTTPTVRRGRFNVTQLEISTSESSCERSDRPQPDDTCYNIDDLRDDEREDDEQTSHSFTKPLKSILRRHSDADTTTLDSETAAMLAEDAAGGATDEDARTPSTEEEGEQESSPLARLPFTPRHLDDILQPPVHLQRKKSVRFTEPMLDKICFAPTRDDERDKNTMNGGSDSTEDREEEEGSEEDRGAEAKQFSLASWRPQCLEQHMVKKELYVLLYILVGIVHGAALTYTISVISTVERRFGMNSRLTGSLLAGHDMSQVIFSLILSYHGRCSHRLRWIGVGMVFVVAACLSAAIPHLLYGFGRGGFGADLAGLVENGTLAIAENTEELCFFVGEETCGGDATAEALLGTVLLLFLSQFFMGIAVTVFYTVGVTFLDHNIDRRTFPLYYGVTLMMRVLGPVLGYLLGSFFLKAWIDPAKAPSLTYRNLEFLDVWWTGSLCILCGLTVSGSLSFLFPRHVPDSFRRRMRKILAKEKVEEEASPAKSKAEESQIRQTLKEAWESARRIFTSKIWVINLFNTTLFALAVSGYWSLRPKYLESQFRKRPMDANFYIGLSSLLSPMFGMGLSGVILLWMRPKVKVLMGYSVFITLCGGAGYIGLIFAGCPKLDIVGPVAGSLTPPCSADCGCSGRFSPMCSEDQITLFYSPCYAGCTLANTSANPTIYYGCSCIESSNGPSRPSPDQEASYTTSGLEGQMTLNQGGRGTPGYCPESCAAFFNYIVLLILTQSVYPSARVSNVMVMLRSVPDEDQVMALSILTVFVSVFAFAPAPAIVSAVVDSACLVWDTSCGATGECSLYNSTKFRTIFHLIPAVFVFICVLCDVAVFCYSRNSELLDECREDLQKRRGCSEEDKPLRSAAYDEAKV